MNTYRLTILAASLAAAGAVRQATYSPQQQADPSQVLDDLNQNLDDMAGLVDKYVQAFIDADAIQAALRAEIASMVAGNAALASKIDAAFAKSVATEDKMRAGIPGLPPVGGTPLLQTYATRAEFDTAVAAYTGPEGVTLDGTGVKAGTSPTLDYFSHSSDGSVSTVGPTD